MLKKITSRLHLWWLKHRGKRPCYVVIYDVVDPNDGVSDTYGHVTEQYYGYFSSPDEARRMWQTFAGPGIDTGFNNVKLCLVVKDWS